MRDLYIKKRKRKRVVMTFPFPTLFSTLFPLFPGSVLLCASVNSINFKQALLAELRRFHGAKALQKNMLHYICLSMSALPRSHSTSPHSLQPSESLNYLLPSRTSCSAPSSVSVFSFIVHLKEPSDRDFLLVRPIRDEKTAAQIDWKP